MSEPRKPRGRMPPKVKVTVRLVQTDSFTYGPLMAEARKGLADRKAVAP